LPLPLIPKGPARWSYNKGMRLLFIFVWALAVPAGLCAGWLEDGIKALDGERYADAAAIFEKAAAADPKDYAAYFHLALAESMLARNEQAVAGYERTLALKPELAEAQMNLGILLTSSNPTRASQLLRAALAKNPESAGGLVALGRLVMADGKLDEAEPLLTKAAKLDPRYNDAVLELANEFEKAKNWDAAQRLYEPGAASPDVAERLGVVMLAAGKPDQAIAPLELAVSKAPSSANQYALAIAYLRTKQPAKALPQLAAASAAEPANLELRLAYGRALRDQRQFAPAAQQFSAVTKLKADSRDAWSELAGMLVMLENYPQALGAYERLEALGEQSAGLNFFKAICQDRLQLKKEALASYEKFLTLSAGASPDQEFQARQRVLLLKREVKK
jgi:tetratricopeptide (TPR) repeat protein